MIEIHFRLINFKFRSIAFQLCFLDHSAKDFEQFHEFGRIWIFLTPYLTESYVLNRHLEHDELCWRSIPQYIGFFDRDKFIFPYLNYYGTGAWMYFDSEALRHWLERNEVVLSMLHYAPLDRIIAPGLETKRSIIWNQILCIIDKNNAIYISFRSHQMQE